MPHSCHPALVSPSSPNSWQVAAGPSSLAGLSVLLPSQAGYSHLPCWNSSGRHCLVAVRPSPSRLALPCLHYWRDQGRLHASPASPSPSPTPWPLSGDLLVDSSGISSTFPPWPFYL